MTAEILAIPRTIGISQNYQRTKRLLDILFSLLILIPLCVVIVVVAICIRLDTDGPIFFRQKRVGFNGVEFEMFKFRSMHVNNDDSWHRAAIAKYMSGQKLVESTTSDLSYKQVDDPRVGDIKSHLLA